MSNILGRYDELSSYAGQGHLIRATACVCGVNVILCRCYHCHWYADGRQGEGRTYRGSSMMSVEKRKRMRPESAKILSFLSSISFPSGARRFLVSLPSRPSEYEPTQATGKPLRITKDLQITKEIPGRQITGSENLIVGSLRTLPPPLCDHRDQQNLPRFRHLSYKYPPRLVVRSRSPPLTTIIPSSNHARANASSSTSGGGTCSSYEVQAQSCFFYNSTSTEEGAIQCW